MKSLINETKKVWTIQGTLFILGVFVIVNIMYYFMNPPITTNNWRSQAEEQKKFDEEYLNDTSSFKTLDTIDVQLINSTKEEIQIINYALDNNIIFGNFNVWSHMKNVMMLAVLAEIFIVLYGIKVVSCEYESSTWKNLIVAQKSRYEILCKKCAYIIIQTFICTVIFGIITFLYGSVFYGHGSSFYDLKVIDGNVVKIFVFPQILKSFLVLFLKSLFYTMIGVMVNIISKSSKRTIVFTFILIVFNSKINSYIQNPILYKLLPFKYLNMNSENLTSLRSLLFFTLILSVYIIVFTVIGNIIFEKRDIN